MDESELLFNLFYLLLCMCIIYPPEEFQRLGLTIEQLFSHWLGEEHLNFVRYHQKRTSLNLFIHSCLPAVYFLIHRFKFSVFTEYNDIEEESDLDPDFPMPQEAVAFKTLTWKVAQRFSLMAVLAVPALILNWYQQDWKRHPITQTLLKFSNVPNDTANLVSDISNEFRRQDVYKKKLNSIATVIATENWIIKTTLYNVHFAHQSDTSLSVAKVKFKFIFVEILIILFSNNSFTIFRPMDESELLFNLFYLLLCMCIIYPPEEFQRLGLTIEQLFSHWLGEEHLNFVRYHQKRTSLNLFIHSCLPAVYFLIHRFKFSVFTEYNDIEEESDLDPDFPMPQEAVAFKTLTWKVAQRFSLMAVLAVPALILNWYQQDWKRHPITQTLLKFSNVPNDTANLVSDISNEFRRQDVYKKKLNSIATVIATENWIIKTTLYNVHFAHQSDTSLSVAKTETYAVSQDNNDTLQMISIVVKTNRAGVADFHIRINALEFRNLEERITRPILIPSNIQFHRNVIDRFIDVFKEQVSLNPIYKADRMAIVCFACMIAEPNIKIHKQCEDVDREGRPLPNERCCTNCYCRPMWCVECLARWFAARQSEHEREVWLEQKCTCPMCRAKFCVLDVSYIEKPVTTALNNENEDNVA